MKISPNEFKRLVYLGRIWEKVRERCYDSVFGVNSFTPENLLSWMNGENSEEIFSRLTELNNGYEEIMELLNAMFCEGDD